MRRVFVSCGPGGERLASELDSILQAENENLELLGRHRLPEGSDPRSKYRDRQSKEGIWGSAVTLVLIELNTHDYELVEKEILWSLEKKPSNGLLGVLVDEEATIPKKLMECGAEIIPWQAVDSIPDAIERAARAAGRAAEPPKPPSEEEQCVRETA